MEEYYWERLISPEELSEESILRILRCLADNSDHALWFKVFYSFGLLVGEFIEIRVSDLDCENQVLHVGNTGRMSERNLIVSEKLAWELKDYVKGRSRTDYLFPGRYGGKLHRRSVQKLFDKIRERTGFRIGIGVLRKTLARHLLDRGWNLKDVSARLGMTHKRSVVSLVGSHPPEYPKLVSTLDEIMYPISKNVL